MTPEERCEIIPQEESVQEDIFYDLEEGETGNQIEILWRDEHYAVINKPAGVIIHRSIFSSERDTLVHRLYRQFDQPPLPVHRLDRPVSGVLAASFGSQPAARLSQAFREGKVDKVYLAVVRGYAPEEGRIDIPLRNYETGVMKEALTEYRRLATAEMPVPSRRFPTSRFSLVEVRLHTGRFHQIRRHLARLGYPIVGDTSHGDTFCNHHFTEHFGVRGLLLHARRLELAHPITGEPLRIVAGLPPRFRKAFDALNWSGTEV
jgi:tRNA pseudouridine65 synthase